MFGKPIPDVCDGRILVKVFSSAMEGEISISATFFVLFIQTAYSHSNRQEPMQGWHII